MIEIDDTLVSTDVLQTRFVCDLNACKGACCVQGDAGAPLENEELKLLEQIFSEVKPYMREEGIKSVELQGKYTKDITGEFVTPLVNNNECAYVVFDSVGIAKCSIEMAYNEGKIEFKKPISCHLYPIRVQAYRNFKAVNYHEWEICEPACECGTKLDVKTHKFLKEPLIRKFGEKWYEKLEEADKLLNS